MAKRYIDTGFYKSPFVRGLQGSLKALYVYIICDCDGSGIWNYDLDVASLYTGFKFTDNEFKKYFIETGKAVDLQNGKFFLPDFIDHQYPKGLSDTNPAHNNFIKELIKYQLIDDNLKVLKRDSKVPQVMVMVMEKVKVKVDSNGNKAENLIFPFNSQKFIEVWETLKKEKKWRKKSPMALQASLNKLAKFGEDGAIQSMLDAISGEYQGVFEPKEQKTKPTFTAHITKVHNQMEKDFIEAEKKYGNNNNQNRLD